MLKQFFGITHPLDDDPEDKPHLDQTELSYGTRVLLAGLCTYFALVGVLLLPRLASIGNLIGH